MASRGGSSSSTGTATPGSRPSGRTESTREPRKTGPQVCSGSGSSSCISCQGQGGFVVLTKRWIVERTFPWLGRYRRLNNVYDANPRSSEAWIRCAMIHLVVRRLAAG